jgi:peptidoglycan/LPS O-acetylase OafA/YrhL
MVVWHHLIQAFHYNGVNHSQTAGGGYAISSTLGTVWQFMFWSGPFSVYLFFLLSGFILPFKYFITKNTTDLADAAFRRYFRLLWPSVMGCTVGFLFHSYHAFEESKYVLAETGSIWTVGNSGVNVRVFPILRFLNEAFITTWVSKAPTLNPNLWTMAMELKGSFLVYLACFATSQLKKPHYGLFFVFLFLSTTPFLQESVHGRYGLFIFGSWLSYLYAERERKSNILTRLQNLEKSPLSWLHTATCFYVFCLGWYAGSYPDHLVGGWIAQVPRWLYGYGGYHRTFWSLTGSILIFVSVICSPRLQAIFSNGLGLFLGRISFSLYVLQGPVICAVGTHAYKYARTELLWAHQESFYFTVFSVFACLVPMSYVGYLLVDKPSISLTRWITKKVYVNTKSSI